jgi:prophage antirepressor-like protein
MKVNSKNKNMKKQAGNKGAVIYQAKSGAIELRGDFGKETIWATQAQIAEIFEIDRSVATKHVGNILKSGEVDEKSNVQKMHIANSDKPVALYSLDIILAVGYRANSAKAIRFRRWVTGVLRKHLVEGYTVNRSRIAKNYSAFLASVESVKKLLPASGAVDAESTIELVRLFAGTWFSLDAYDRSTLPKTGTTKRQVRVTGDDLDTALGELKQELLRKKEATDIFAEERQKDAVSGIVGNVFQTFGGKDLYPTVEEKAAHLLYFVVKNHPFVDGNKRSGAFSFVWFLRKARVLDSARLTPEALTALTLLVAESDPKDKDRVTALVVNLIRG